MAMVAGGTGEQRGEQVLDLITGQPDQLGWWWAGAVGQRGDHQKGGATMARVVQRSQERQRRT
jgi:hypothetical protein